jgi:hypothetical protein
MSLQKGRYSRAAIQRTRQAAPMANGRILGSAQNVTFGRVDGVPGQAVTFLGVAIEGDVGLAEVVGRLGRVLCPVKDVDRARWRLGGDQIRVLGHVPRSVHFAIVVDALNNLDASSHVAVSPNFWASQY